MVCILSLDIALKLKLPLMALYRIIPSSTYRNINILGGSSVTAGIVQGSDLVGAVAGDITLNATGEIKIGQGSNVFNVVQNQAQGNGGNLTINAQQLLVQDGAEVRTTTRGAGKGGNLTVNATEKVEISGLRTSANGKASASALLTGATATGEDLAAAAQCRVRAATTLTARERSLCPYSAPPNKRVAFPSCVTFPPTRICIRGSHP
ncbi:hypothetical protein V5G28_032635 [Scytonema sp. PRP1]